MSNINDNNLSDDENDDINNTSTHDEDNFLPFLETNSNNNNNNDHEFSDNDISSKIIEINQKNKISSLKQSDILNQT